MVVLAMVLSKVEGFLLQSDGDLLHQFESVSDDFNNVSDWSLKTFQEVYKSDEISKADIWEYLYGVMHAPDWREKFGNELQKNLPRIPLVPGGLEAFVAFQEAGCELLELHANFEFQQEADVEIELDEGGSYRIDDRMRWLDLQKTALEINASCRLVGIPADAHEYKISGRSPLEWAVGTLCRKVDKKSGIVDDPNGWHAWCDNPFELVRHLRRLAYIGIRTTTIVNSLPPSLPTEKF